MAFDEEDELHARLSSSPERNSAPRLNSRSHRRNSSPSTTDSFVSPSAQAATVVIGGSPPKASRNCGEAWSE
jgi:hypothetical protein